MFLFRVWCHFEVSSVSFFFGKSHKEFFFNFFLPHFIVRIFFIRILLSAFSYPAIPHPVHILQTPFSSPAVPGKIVQSFLSLA